MSATINLGPTYGALLVAGFVCAFLFGVASLQAYLYYHLYPNDQLLHRLSVGCLWCLDAFTACLLVNALYQYLIAGFGDFIGLEIATWSVKLHVTVSLITMPVVQSLYGLRAWKQRDCCKVTTILLPVILIAAWVMSIKVAFHTWRQIDFSEIIDTGKGDIYAYFSVCSFVDIVNTLALCRSLYKPEHTFTLTKSLIRNLILWVVGTGMLTCCITIAVIIVFAAMPTNFVFLSIAFVLARLHINGFLAMLNVRRDMRHSATKQVMMLPTINSPTETTRPEVPIAIRITHQKESSWAPQTDSSSCKDITEIQAEV